MENKATRIGKRIMTVMLSLVMVAGVFAGMKLDVKAAETREINLRDYSNLEGEKWIYYDNITSEDVFRICIPFQKAAVRIWYLGTKESGIYQMLNTEDYSLNENLERGKSYKLSVKITLDKDMNWYRLHFYFEENKPQEIGNASEKKADTSHTCNFEWVTTIDPTTGADGLEQYKCTECGVVKESHSIPASVAVIKDFYGNIKEAPENGSITYDSGKLYTISDYLLKKMSERSDVTVTVNFEYQNAKYELTFPAGTDFTPVLTDEDTMYGYFGVAAKLGLTVTAK